MLNKTIKLFEIILTGAIVFGFAPSALYAYNLYVSTGNVTNVTPTNATFNGFVNGGNSPTKAWFEYDTDASFKNSTFTNAYSFNSGYGGGYSTSVSELNQNTTYSFRAVAQNSQGRVYGNAYSFTTNFTNIVNDTSYLFLTAITEPASFISNKSVQLNSLIYNEAGEFSNTWFEWGISPTSLSNKTTLIQTEIFPSIRHADTLTGLTPGTTYYFRTVAENFSRRSNGSILSFVTNSGVSPAKGGAGQNNTIGTIGGKNSTTGTTKENRESTNLVQSTFGANVFGIGSFFPINILGWLILLILILILILLSKYLYGKFSDKKTIASDRV